MKTFLKNIFLFSVILLSPSFLTAQEVIDAGIFEDSGGTVFTIKARPAYTISGLALTNAQLTIRWEETSGVTGLTWQGTSIGLMPQGGVITENGYHYQVYGSFGGGTLNWAAGNEYTILTIAPDNPDVDCAKFEIALDDWTASHNGDLYFEVVGADRTGVRYRPYLNYGSEGGSVDGDSSIYLGESTGLMTLQNYSGDILGWQRNANQQGWLDIANTAGMASYEEIPSPDGLYRYRTAVQLGDCPVAYSTAATVTVELLAVWSGAEDTVWDNFNNWNSVGVPDPYTDALIPGSSSGFDPFIPGEASCKRLSIEAGAYVRIGPQGELTLSGDLLNEGALEIACDTGHTGSLLDNGSIMGAGNFISRLAIDGGTHMFSPAVPGMVAGDIVLEQNLYVWDEPTQCWGITWDTGQALETLRGYLAVTIMPTTLEFAGNAFHSGACSIPLTTYGLGNGFAGGFNAVGNPYPSAVNWNSAPGWILNQTDPVLYVYQNDASTFGTYIRNDPESSTLNTDSIIAAGQGFFVHVTPGFAEGEMAVNNLARLHAHRNIAKGKRPDPAGPILRMVIGLSPFQNGQRDEVVVRFQPGASNQFDARDALDLSGPGYAPVLFTRCPDTLRTQVNTFPPLEENTDITMGFLPVQTGNFILKVTEMSGFGPDTLVYLEDLKWDQMYLLTEGTTLPLLSFPGDEIDRFVLHFHTDPVSVYEKKADKSLIVNKYDGKLYIFSLENIAFDHIFVTDLSGRVIVRKAVKTNKVILDFDQPTGLYIIHAVQGTRQLTEKFFNF